MDIQAFKEAGHAAVERIARYHEDLQSNSIPVTVPLEPGALREHVTPQPPLKGETFSAIIEDFERLILPGCTHWQHPAFFGFFPSSATFESIIADMYSSAVGNPGFNWACSPISTDLEFIVMDWVAELFGLSDMYKSTSETGGGIIMGTASEAFLTMCVAARERANCYIDIISTVSATSQTYLDKELDNYPTESSWKCHGEVSWGTKRATTSERFVIYGSSEAHSMGAKAAKVLGFTWKPITVGIENGWRLTGQALRKRLEEDVSSSLVPCILMVSVGTTNSGAVDHLDELVEVSQDYPSLWIHVDAAWAGSYLGLKAFRHELQLETINKHPLEDHPWAAGSKNQQRYYSASPAGIVHSFCTNLHKSGLVGFECTTNFVRNKHLIIDSIQQSQPCLESSEGNANRALDIRNWEIPLGRRFRSLKVYFVLRSYGLEGFQKELQRTIDVAEYFERLIQSSTLLETVFKRSLSLVVFQMNSKKARVKNESNSDLKTICDLQSKRLAKKLEDTHQIFLTSCVVDGRFCLRLAVGRMTHRNHLDESWNVLTGCAQEVMNEWEYETHSKP